MAQSPAAAGAAAAAGRPYLECIEMPVFAALQALAHASRDLLRDTAELPDSEQGLPDVLAEYRCAVYAFLAIAGGL